jgi:hypothetical protein
MRLRRQSKKRRVADAVGAYLQFKAISKTAKAARKSLQGFAAYKAAGRAPAAVKALPLVAGVGAAGAVAARRRRHTEAAPA